MGVEGFVQFVEDLAEQALLEAGVPPEQSPNLAGASAQRDLPHRAALFAEPRSSRSSSRQRVGVIRGDGSGRPRIPSEECRLRTPRGMTGRTGQP